MAELKIHDQTTSNISSSGRIRQYRNKRWVIALKRPEKGLQVQNKLTERDYHSVIEALKTLYLRPGETYYERNLKQDKSEGLYSMHTFVCSSFLWRLECELTYTYKVEYAFHNCPFEAEIREIMKSYPLDRTAHKCDLPVDLNKFYKRVLEIQDPIYIKTIKSTG